MMATAGCDGVIRLWHFPSLNPLREIIAHTKEVDDLDFSPDCQKVWLFPLISNRIFLTCAFIMNRL